ncbi:hypothetical protein Taro_012887 [Colocasia esculenta]|uniref:Uncharacterized protein n=1 Tax=Colocasia esculenta TaxID=4460 RepID=A0A843UET1_COLES|nr:hypothetical protein [Colocasia esculenta]
MAKRPHEGRTRRGSVSTEGLTRSRRRYRRWRRAGRPRRRPRVWRRSQRFRAGSQWGWVRGAGPSPRSRACGRAARGRGPGSRGVDRFAEAGCSRGRRGAPRDRCGAGAGVRGRGEGGLAWRGGGVRAARAGTGKKGAARRSLAFAGVGGRFAARGGRRRPGRREGGARWVAGPEKVAFARGGGKRVARAAPPCAEGQLQRVVDGVVGREKECGAFGSDIN